MNAQDLTSSADIRIRAVVRDTKYCLGRTSYFPVSDQPGDLDITLWFTLDLVYENSSEQPLIVPLRFHSRGQMLVEGQTATQTIEAREDHTDFARVAPDARPLPPYFIVVPPESSQQKYLGEFLSVRVKGSAGSLLGTKVRIWLNRDHRLISQPLAEQLQERWKAEGRLWLGALDSDWVDISIPRSPVTVDCRKDERF